MDACIPIPDIHQDFLFTQRTINDMIDFIRITKSFTEDKFVEKCFVLLDKIDVSSEFLFADVKTSDSMQFLHFLLEVHEIIQVHEIRLPFISCCIIVIVIENLCFLEIPSDSQSIS